MEETQEAAAEAAQVKEAVGVEEAEVEEVAVRPLVFFKWDSERKEGHWRRPRPR